MTANGNGTAQDLGAGIEIVAPQKLQPESKIYGRVQQLIAFFKQQFGANPDFIVRVPGRWAVPLVVHIYSPLSMISPPSPRVNIIGEHVDYCGYSVLPMAVSQSIFLAVAKNPSGSQLQLRNLEEAKFTGYDADLKTLRWVNQKHDNYRP